MLVFEAPFHVYILASQRNGTLYVGSTDELARRVWEHKFGKAPGFTQRYGVKQLVWFEPWGSGREAFLRERRIKEWRRRWKLRLIEDLNPDWEDLGLRPEIAQHFAAEAAKRTFIITTTTTTNTVIPAKAGTQYSPAKAGATTVVAGG